MTHADDTENTENRIDYSQRPKPFGREVIFRLDPQHLYVDSGRRQEHIPYRDIASIRLVYEPKNITSGFRTTLTTKAGRTVTFTNLDWKSYLEYERRDGAYAALVTALLDKAGRFNPDLVCIGGRPPLLWGLTALVGTATFAGMVAAVGWALLQGYWTYGLLATVFLIPFTYQIHGMIMRNRPLRFGPQEPPMQLLPAVKA